MEHTSTFAGIFSGNPDTTSASGPSQFVLTTSSDGLTWSNFQPLYYGHHDPIVLKKNGQYILYGMYLSKYMTTAVSSDGINWPASPDSVSFLDTTNAPMLVNSTKRIGDVGGVVMPNKDIYLYTNYSGTNPAVPSKDIIRFTLQNPTGVSANNQLPHSISVLPNPFSSQTNLYSDNLLKNATLSVYNLYGQTVKQIKNISGQTVILSRDNLSSGLYFIRLTEENKIYTDKLVITDK